MCLGSILKILCFFAEFHINLYKELRWRSQLPRYNYRTINLLCDEITYEEITEDEFTDDEFTVLWNYPQLNYI